MAAGDVQVYVIPVNDDGTGMDTFLTGKGIVVADSVSMAQINHNRVVVLVIKAA